MTLLLVLLLFSSFVIFIKMEIVPSTMLCNPQVFKMIEARFGNEKLMLCLKLKPIGSSPLTSQDSALILDPEEDDDPSEETVRGLPLRDFTMAYGFPAEDPSSGSAEGYIGEDHNFYGVVHLGNRTLHADPYYRDSPYRDFGSFEHDHMTPRQKRSRHAQVDYDRHFLPYQIESPVRSYSTARGRVCDLLLLADRNFFVKDANSSLNHVVRRMIHAVAQADVIFRNADFNEDGIPDNIGFQVKYILVLTSKDTNKRIFGHMGQHSAVDGKEYLMKFARLRRLSEVCLGVAFTGHAFHNRTLGLSFTSLGGGLGGAAGGLCDRRAYGRSYNTLAVAHSTTDDQLRVPERVAAMTLAHELGHSFGAHHDDNFPNPECRGYLMGSQSSPLAGHTLEFSLCSKRLIASTLNSMSYCLTDENKPFCGNGIVEEGEACDCGLPTRCNIKDPCCTPRAGAALLLGDGTLHKEGCSVSPTANCHPSQGLCCLADCKYADLSKSGIECKHQDMDCKCHNDTRACRCGLGGRCLPDASCHAAECALLGLRECQCIRSPGGALGDARSCGICCVQSDIEGTSPKCVGAEEAAFTLLAQGTAPPDDWPGDDYIGPNITIRLCKDSKCKTASLRAWSVGSKCVSRGAVGVCNARGVCSTSLHTPRSNVFPDVKVKEKSQGEKINGARKALFKCYFVILSVIIHLTLN